MTGKTCNHFMHQLFVMLAEIVQKINNNEERYNGINILVSAYMHAWLYISYHSGDRKMTPHVLFYLVRYRYEYSKIIWLCGLYAFNFKLIIMADFDESKNVTPLIYDITVPPLWSII